MKQIDRSTEMTFARPLSASYGNEVGVSTSGQVYILWAYDPKESLSFHSKYGSVALDLSSCETTAVEASRTMIIAHGSLMFVSWGLLLPVGSFLPSLAKIDIHKILQGGGVFLALIAFMCSVVYTGRNSGVHFSNPHAVFGILVIGLAVVQVLLALARPRKVSEPPKSCTKRKVWEYIHRGLGWVLAVLGLLTIPTGLYSLHAAKSLIYASYAWVVVFLLVAVGTKVYKKFCCSLVDAALESQDPKCSTDSRVAPEDGNDDQVLEI